MKPLRLLLLTLVASVACSSPGQFMLDPDSGPVSDLGGPSDVSCPADQLACGAACVDPRVDTSHCGACGVTCPTGNVCLNGACALECPMGQTRCGALCVTLGTDVEHCGACGTVCPRGEVCSGGRCDPTCAPQFLLCQEVPLRLDGGAADTGARRDAGPPRRYCTDPQADERNCGGCGMQCPLGHRCEAGTCVLRCTDRQTLCTDRCTDLQTDNGNCGACGNRCGTMERCTAGVCVATRCPPSTMLCGARCADLTSDPSNCGLCGRTCAAHQVCAMGMCATECALPAVPCEGRCVDPQRDRSHCGRCGNACPAGQTCELGMCRLLCPMGTLACMGRCVTPTTDSANCGACGTVCPRGQLCAGGSCAPTCAMTQTNCAGVCVDLQVDPSNCGACGVTCGPGYACGGGVCRPLVGTDVRDCGPPSVQCAVCTDLRSDNTNCGRCGQVCTADRTCANGMCLAPCAAGQSRCGTTCVDLRSDRMNCGMCGRACASALSCGGGVCVMEPTFRVTSYSAAGCRSVDHDALSGDDRGGIAASAAVVLYTGDSSTVRYSAADLTGGMALGLQWDALVGDLQTERMYTFGTGPTVPMTFGGGVATHLIELDPMTGAITTRSTALSAPITMGSGTGIFSGYGRIAVAAGGRVFQIRMPDGVVTVVGSMVFPRHAGCESWAFWGVAEYFGGALYLDYAAGFATPAVINRVRVPDGMITPVASFPGGYSDLCSFTFLPSRNRWYFHHEGSSPLGTGSEVLGYCDGRWESP